MESELRGFSCLWKKAGGLTLGPPLLTRVRPIKLKTKKWLLQIIILIIIYLVTS